MTPTNFFRRSARLLWIRSILLLIVFLPFWTWSLVYTTQETQRARFDFLALSNGMVSFIQSENGLDHSPNILPGDRTLRIHRMDFQPDVLKKWLNQQEAGQKVAILLKRGQDEVQTTSVLKRYSKGPLLVFGYLPLLLSLIFFAFSLLLPFQRGIYRKSAESVEVFSAFCFLIAIFFMTFLPSVSLGMNYSFSILTPLMAVLLVHLFVVYPKEKGGRIFRWILLGLGYAGALTLAALRFYDWNQLNWLWVHVINLPLLGGSFLLAMGCLGNTLLTSKDFWARRRARLISLVFLASFIAILSVFVASVWTVPRISLERILGLSLFFPSAFLVIFLKSDVFDLERIFRRGLHQLLLLSMAVVFAVLVGVGWSQWRVNRENDWLLWVAIGIVVVALSRPAGNLFEGAVHRLIRTRVKYPNVDAIFERSSSVESFLASLFSHCETFLNMRFIRLRFLQDPTSAWKKGNEQIWVWADGQLSRTFEEPPEGAFEFSLTRGDQRIGRLSFDGGDALAFDPFSSREWLEVVKAISRCLELLCLREFLTVQQGFLAVGRMQSLLAHEMKNPLAIIKVCSGILASHVKGSEEAEELLRTIQGEVTRVASGVQNIFDQSGRAEEKQKVSLNLLLAQVEEKMRYRFPQREFIKKFFRNGRVASTASSHDLYVEKEGLKQSLINLVTNAYEAGSPFVILEVHLGDGVGMKIFVRDQGGGIPDSLELFKPFVTTKPKGTGLGLVHVKAFMERNSGQVRVRTEKGGTTFVLEFSSQTVLNGDEIGGLHGKHVH